MSDATTLSSVLIPLSARAGEMAQVQDLLNMLEHCFIDAFKMSLPSDAKSKKEETAATSPASPLPPSSSPSIDAGEEAKLLAVRAVTSFHRSGAARHRAFFQNHDYHPHAALFILELLKSLSGNSQQWFRQLQLESLEACLAIVEVIGMDNVRLCLPGLVSVAVRYVHRSHHGKDSSKVCLTALRLLRTALVLSLASAEPATWVRDTIAHLTNALRPILEPAALVRGAYGPAVTIALESLVTSLLLAPAMTRQHLSSPLGELLVVAFAAVANMDHLHHLGDDAVGAAKPEASLVSSPVDAAVHRNERTTLTGQEVRQLEATLGSPCAVAAVQDALRCLRGVELLHVATTAVRLPALRDHFFPLRPPTASSLLSSSPSDGCGELGAVRERSSEAVRQLSTDSSADGDGMVVAVFLSVVRKCVRLVGTEMGDEALYTHRRPRKFPAGVVDEFLFRLAGTLGRLPNASIDLPDDDAAGEEQAEDEAETVGERLTNALLDEYGGVLEDWDAYAVHPAVLYVLTRLVVWQFHPLHAAALDTKREVEEVLFAPQSVGVDSVSPSPCDLITSGAFEQLWSTVAPPHLWNITEDEDLCNNQQIHHRQLVAATLLRFLALTAEVLAATPAIADGAGEAGVSSTPSQETLDALERLYALTLYLVLEKATASGVVHEAAMRCVEAYSAASTQADALAFLLHHSALLVDETGRAIKEAHLRPAAASVLRGSLAFVAARLTRPANTQATAQVGGGGTMSGGRTRFGGASTQLTALVRQRLSVDELSALFLRGGASLASLEAVAQVADFVGSTMHVARDALYLCSRYDSRAESEDLEGRRAALALLRDALDLAAYLNFIVPQEALDEDQERHTTSAHTRVRALQTAVLDAIYTVLQHCTVHDATAPLAVQTVVRGLTCFLTTSTAVGWAEAARQRLHEAEMARRKAKREGRKKKFMEKATDNDSAENPEKEKTEDEEEEEEDSNDGGSRAALPASPPLDWPWTHYLAAEDAAVVATGEAAPPPVRIELPRSHLHTVYRAYLSFFALLREPMAAFATVTAGPGARKGMERRKLADVAVTTAVFETLNGLESLRLLACDFLLHRMVGEVLPLVVLWHERGCVTRIPTHTEERLKAATQQFVVRLWQDCSGDSELQAGISKQCRGFPLLAAATPMTAQADAVESSDPDAIQRTLLVPRKPADFAE